MTFATKMFRFPFEAGEPLTFKLEQLEWKLTYDKFYVCDYKEPLSRREVCYYALANSAFVTSGQAIDMRRQARKIIFADESAPFLPKCPEYLGMALGPFIPRGMIFGRPSSEGHDQKTPYSMEWLQAHLRENEEHFFEGCTEFWIEILPGKGLPKPLSEYAASGRSVWVNWDMRKHFKEIYDQYRADGMPSLPRYENELGWLLAEEKRKKESETR